MEIVRTIWSSVTQQQRQDVMRIFRLRRHLSGSLLRTMVTTKALLHRVRATDTLMGTPTATRSKLWKPETVIAGTPPMVLLYRRSSYARKE